MVYSCSHNLIIEIKQYSFRRTKLLRVNKTSEFRDKIKISFIKNGKKMDKGTKITNKFVLSKLYKKFL